MEQQQPIKVTVECKTCKKVTHTFESKSDRPSINELIQKMNVGILSNHVKAPCSCNHQIEASDIPSTALWGPRRLLKIECLHPSCANKPTRTFEKMVPVELISMCSLQFHAIHEGHPIQVQWGDTFSVRTP